MTWERAPRDAGSVLGNPPGVDGNREQEAKAFSKRRQTGGLGASHSFSPSGGGVGQHAVRRQGAKCTN